MPSSLNIAVVPVESDLDVNSVASVKRAIDSLIGQGCRRIVLNLSGASYVDSAGMGLIISELRSMRSHGGLLSLAGVSEDVYRILSTLRVVDFMPVRLAAERTAVPELDVHAIPLRATTLAVDAASLGDVRRRVGQLLEGLSLSADERFDLTLAAGEALGNAVDHACAEGAIATVSTYRDRVVIDVEDCGEGFSLADDEPIECDKDAERGRGIQLMRLLADAVTIRLRPQGTGTQVRLVKLLH